MNSLTKKQAREKINDFFLRDKFSSDEVRKIKKLAMKFNIKLGVYRVKFCKECLSQLKGKIRVTKIHRTVVCVKCGAVNRIILGTKKT